MKHRAKRGIAPIDFGAAFTSIRTMAACECHAVMREPACIRCLPIVHVHSAIQHEADGLDGACNACLDQSPLGYCAGT